MEAKVTKDSVGSEATTQGGHAGGMKSPPARAKRLAGYASFEQYMEKYLRGRAPAISETDFPYWSQRASSVIDQATFNRLEDAETLKKNEEAVVLCCCELAEYAQVTEEHRGLQSVSITGHSMSFDKKQQRADVLEIVQRYLYITGLLFAGVP